MKLLFASSVRLKNFGVAAFAFSLTAVQAATFTVTAVVDGAPGSLRSAIAQANLIPGPDVIVFDFPSYPTTLTFNSALPDITEAVIIDATGGLPCTTATQPRIQLDGIGLGANIDGLVARGSAAGPIAVMIKGLAIYRFPGAGIRLDRNTNSIVTGNNLGTDASGTSFGIGNGDGIVISDSTNVVVGGAAPCVRNLISGNTRSGVSIFAGADNRVVGNIIGLRGDGLWPMPNHDGVNLTAGTRNRIGSTQPGEANVISGNQQSGVQLNGPLAVRMDGVVEGNFIGTRADGSFPVPNGADGVYFFGGPTGNFIEHNTIAFNSGDGVRVLEGIDNTIVENSIFNNGILGIDITPSYQPNPNDNCDSDTGPNRLQNYPLLAGVFDFGASVQIDGNLNSEPVPGYIYRIDFCWSATCDPSGFGEGHHYIGNTTVTPSGAGSCDMGFSVSFPVHVPPGSKVTATATHPLGSTSEFSPCMNVISLGTNIIHGGLPHLPVAGATITESNGWLDVSGVNSSGSNGVRIALGRAQGWQGAIDSFPLGPGDSLTTRVMRQNGSNSSALASARIAVGSNTMSFLGDFNLGNSNPPSLRLEFRDDDNRLISSIRMTNGFPYNLPPCAQGQNPEVCSNAFVSLSTGEPAFWWKFCKWICMPCPGCDPPAYLPVRVACLVAETPQLVNPCVTCIDVGTNSSSTIDLLPKIGPNNVSGGHLRLGQEWLQQFGNFHQQVGNVSMEGWGDYTGNTLPGGTLLPAIQRNLKSLHVKLSSSPSAAGKSKPKMGDGDGVMALLDHARYAMVDWNSATFSIDWSWILRNCTNPVTMLPDFVAVQAANPGANISFGFPLSGASTARLDFYQQGTLVSTLTAGTGDVISANSPPFRGARATSQFTPLGTAGFGLYWRDAASIIIVARSVAAAGEPIIADELHITPINPATPPPWLSRIDAVAMGVPSFEILMEDTKPAVPGPLTIQRLGSQVQLSYPTERGRPYVLEFKSLLNAQSWQVLENFFGDGSVRVVNEPTTSQRFYRLGGM